MPAAVAQSLSHGGLQPVPLLCKGEVGGLMRGALAREHRNGAALSAPPRGYQWVRSGNDAVLIAITSGIIGAVVGSVIR